MATLALANIMCPKYGFDDPLLEKLFAHVPGAIEGNKFDVYMESLFPPCELDVITLQLSHSKEEMIEYSRCDSKVFQQFFSFSQNRLCMTFNSLPHVHMFRPKVVTPSIVAGNPRNARYTEWSYDNMMDFRGSLDTVPIYGLEEILLVVHKQEETHQNLCTHLSKDVPSVIIHSPNEIPLYFDNEIEHMLRKNVRFMKMFDVAVAPRISLARSDLAQYSPRERGCLFAHEKNLHLFKSYTKRNCELECIVELYLMSCGCVPYFYPRHNDSVKVCLHPCSRPKYKCDCLPDCNYLTYDLITQETPGPLMEETNSTPRAYIQVMMRGKTFYTTIRYSITSFAEFLAYSLGVLGVFLGFSVTCMWRLLYFGAVNIMRTIKAYCTKEIFPVP
ncbi:pickpocket protein 28-like [Macrosteles quadrilineatus]|uniref:pickpocket protein 28-like n=1 Tax=Macrosteles quadrilineatus TaxID=74068 RepID=UPI0023E1F8B4|nr:pickpocket protein 28-like [Macrosteles quadrilineatus]